MKQVTTILSIALVMVASKAAGQSYDYDPAGRLIRVVYTGGQGVTYNYDSRDNLARLESLTVPAAPQNVRIERLSNFDATLSWEHPGPVGSFQIEKRIVGTVDWVPLSEFALDGAARSIPVDLNDGEAVAFRVIANPETFGGPSSVPSLSVQATSQNALFVNTSIDENDHALNRGYGDSLREVIEAAVAGDVIKFGGSDGGFSPLRDGSTIRLTEGELVIDKDLTIDASEHPGGFGYGLFDDGTATAFPPGITIDAAGDSRVIRIAPGVTVTLKGLTLRGGAAENGAGLFVGGGTLILRECTFIDNLALESGGGVFVESGDVQIIQCNFSLNAAPTGGAIANGVGGVLGVSFSTFSENGAEEGGGIYNLEGDATIRTSTFRANSAASAGGGFVNAEARTLIENCTFAENTSGEDKGGAIANVDLADLNNADLVLRNCTIADNVGGGVWNESSTLLSIDNSILANNVSLLNTPLDLSGDYTAVAANLVRTHIGTRLGGPAPLTVDPLLEPLASYGGRSWTMPPLVGSPVIDAGVGTANSPSTDQKSNFRPKGAAPDLGAVESNLSSDTDLLWLTTSAGTLTPSFRSIGLDYTASVSGSMATAAVRPAGAQSGQTIEVRINGGAYSTVASKAASAALALAPGENAVQVRVTAENGTTNKTYTLKINRGAPTDSDTTLASLAMGSASLNPAFQSSGFSYDAVVSNNTASTTVTATPGASGTTLEVRANLGAYVPINAGAVSPPLALKVGSNAIDVRVRSKNDGSSSVYTVTMTREAPAIANALLASLSTTAGTLTPAFSRGRTVYRVNTTDAVTNATVTAIVAQTGATLQLRVNGGTPSALSSGAASGFFGLNAGENIVQVLVTAQDGATLNPYTLIITRIIDGLGAASKDGNSASVSPSISADCRFIAFSSRATNLVTGDSNNKEDVFVYDRMADTIERVSVDNSGNQGNFDSSRPSISADGRFVAFQSEATNLVAGDSNGDIDRSFGKDIFVYDRETDTIERVSLTDSGGEANQASEAPSISGDGRYVAFVSGANNLVSGYANGEYNVYVRDRTDDTLVGISVPFGSYVANLNSLNPAISNDGNYVAFEFSVDKSVDSTPGYQYRDIYLYNRVTQGVQRITGTEIGLDADQTQSAAPSISADGRYVAFQSNLENLDFYDTNTALDVFVYDRTDGSIRRVSANGSEGGEVNKESTHPSISGDGRFVAFASQASNLVGSDSNGSTDIFLKDTVSGDMLLMSASPTGVQGNAGSFWPAVSFDGRCVAFHSNATNLKTADTNGASDVFVAFTEELAPSSAVELASLSSNLGAVRSAEDAYDGGVAPGVNLALLQPIPVDPGATVEARVNSGAFISLPADGVFSLPLAAGVNTIEIKVTAVDGSTTRTSTISISRVLPSSNADLASLVTSTGSLSPSLSDNTSLYSVVVPNATTSMTLRPTTADANAVVTVNGASVSSGVAGPAIELAVGSNSVITQVIAEDGVTSRTYALNVSREFKSTDLFELISSAGTFDPGFSADTTSYTLSVPYQVAEITFTPTTAFDTATVEVNGEAVDSGSSSSAISLEVGDTTITSVVRAAGGGSSQTYSVTVSRAEEDAVETSSRLANLSVRTTLAEAQTLIVGFVMQGGEKEVLVRAAGPALNDFGLSGLPDPRLELYNGAALISENEDWEAGLSVTFSTLGAFAFAADSLDAALMQSLSGPHTVHAKGVGTGTVLVEAYDAGDGTELRLVNLSARNLVGTGDNVLIAGFVISGTGTKTVVIRGIGPRLGDFGVPGFLEDPKIELFDNASALIAANDDWDASLTSTFAELGAFELVAGSPDSALIVTLEAGALYTVVLSGADGGTGEALVEVYEVE